MRDLRDLTRLRTAITQERTRAIQRLEKVMQDAGIKLTSVASQAYSKTARAIMSALLAGVSDPAELAALAKGRLRSKTGRLTEALANRFRLTHHGVLVRRLLAHIDSLDEQLAALDAKITTMVEPIADLVELLCTIPGVAPSTAHVLLAECGWDMSVFPSAGHLASWAGICPGNNAAAERFFAALKDEMYYRQSFPGHAYARFAVADYIEVFYNRQRLHSTLGYRTPFEVLSEFQTAATAA